MKSMHIKSREPFILNVGDFVEIVNQLRLERAEDEESKKPLSPEEALGSMRLLQNRDSVHGMMYFRLYYKDNDGTPCTRDFPNFGLNVQSNSSIKLIDSKIVIDVDLKMLASSAKWQKNEIQECHEIFSGEDAVVGLEITLDETTDYFGYSAQLPVIGGDFEKIEISKFSLL